MNKQEFLDRLEKSLAGLPQKDINDRLSFYDEMIDDYMEEGLSEEEAVSEIGSIEDAVSQIVADTPLTKIVRERMQPKRKLSAWEIILLILGSPVWLSVLIAVFSVALSVYIVLWAVIIVLWASFAALTMCAVAGVVGIILYACGEKPLVGAAILGGGMACAGLAIFLFFGCKAATKGALWLTKQMIMGIKHGFMKKENVK